MAAAWHADGLVDRPFSRVGPYDRAAALARNGDRGAWKICGGI
jgi:hypothetical protein